MRCAIWYHLYNFKNVKYTHGGTLLLVKLQAEGCNFTKINFRPWVFFYVFKASHISNKKKFASIKVPTILPQQHYVIAIIKIRQ